MEDARLAPGSVRIDGVKLGSSRSYRSLKLGRTCSNDRALTIPVYPLHYVIVRLETKV